MDPPEQVKLSPVRAGPSMPQKERGECRYVDVARNADASELL